MAAKPAIFLVDEPTKGVDVGARAELYQRLRALANEGAAVVVCSTDGISRRALRPRADLRARQDRARAYRRRLVRHFHHRSQPDRHSSRAVGTARADGTADGEGSWPVIISRRPCSPCSPGSFSPARRLSNRSSYPPFNISTMLAFLAILTFVSLAEIVTVLVGAIDLSVGALAGLTVVLASFLTPDGAPAAVVLAGRSSSWCARPLRAPSGMAGDKSPYSGDRRDARILRWPPGRVAGAPAEGRRGDHRRAVGCISVLPPRHSLWHDLRACRGGRARMGALPSADWPHDARRRSSPLAAERLGIDRNRHILIAFGLAAF